MTYERPVDRLEKEVARKRALNAALVAGADEMRRLREENERLTKELADTKRALATLQATVSAGGDWREL